MTAVIKTYKSMIKKKIKKHDKTVKYHRKNSQNKLNTIEILISKVSIDPNISHNQFFSVNDVLKEYNDIKETI